MADDFKVGDVVELKSGGPEMTVSSVGGIGGNGDVWCQWFGGRKLEKGKFPSASLVFAENGDDE